eukprot:CAMPEP_0171560618 /NCGR_PEP_ID=MMETSP0960-20121227/13743_1 /TAXON_ID=87120 /ORGANISM="Aurantiochytrium limacinum, Strain ATCCMYA-1381" /LENGTH=85 /DNA_ID=CAMNT_0012112731 /DNA_START=955 /DNA_END=1212 /DNA_ORIENTATION=-
MAKTSSTSACLADPFSLFASVALDELELEPDDDSLPDLDREEPELEPEDEEPDDDEDLEEDTEPDRCERPLLATLLPLSSSLDSL